MSKPAAHGVHTLEALKSRCKIDDYTSCWEFAGAFSGKVPRINTFNPYKGYAEVCTGNRAAWLIAGGADPAGRVVYHSKCMNARCVNPDHLACGTKKQAAASAKKAGSFDVTPAKRAANMKNSRRRPGVLPPEVVRDVRHSDETGKAVSARLGISQQVVSKIRRGESYKDSVAGSSVFSWAAAA